VLMPQLQQVGRRARALVAGAGAAAARKSARGGRAGARSPPPGLQGLGLSPTQAGQVQAAMLAAYLAGQLPSGVLADRLGGTRWARVPGEAQLLRSCTFTAVLSALWAGCTPPARSARGLPPAANQQSAAGRSPRRLPLVTHPAGRTHHRAVAATAARRWPPRRPAACAPAACRVLLVGLLLWSLATAGVAAATSVEQVLATRLVMGLASAGIMPCIAGAACGPRPATGAGRVFMIAAPLGSRCVSPPPHPPRAAAGLQELVVPRWGASGTRPPRPGKCPQRADRCTPGRCRATHVGTGGWLLVTPLGRVCVWGGGAADLRGNGRVHGVSQAPAGHGLRMRAAGQSAQLVRRSLCAALPCSDERGGPECSAGPSTVVCCSAMQR